MNWANRVPLLGLAVTFIILASVDALASPADVDRIRKHTASSDELSYVVYLDDDCGVNRDDAISTVEGVLIRSRIVPSYGIDATHLVVSLSCIDRGTLKPIFNLEVQYSVMLEGEYWDMWRDYGSYGTGDSSSMIDFIKDAVEKAVTDLILAHRT